MRDDNTMQVVSLCLLLMSLNLNNVYFVANDLIISHGLCQKFVQYTTVDWLPFCP